MGIWSDLRVLYHLNLKPIRGSTHAERLEHFYSQQAEVYDVYREKLLLGRRELIRQIEFPRGGVWVDFGGGTGRSLEFIGQSLSELKKVYVVDLCPSLLAIARRRVKSFGWTNVEIVHGDATSFRPPEGYADVVTFSYSLTMIPDWYLALEHARSLLRPGGKIAVVDFYHSRKYPGPMRSRHNWLTRTFWPVLLSRDNVFLSPDQLPYLENKFTTLHITEGFAKIPYILLLKAPYYLYVGSKLPDEP
ncbi:MAG: class I SAM-dependent methyltransferase [Mariniblastus sp.]|nr:class I SAM-dependent methyltransferase [Mariniblastus sp.]